MSYLHCHNCKWEQDDFWDEEYNPITFLEKNLKGDLLSKNLDSLITCDSWAGSEREGWSHYTKLITNRDLIRDHLKSAINNIEKMVWRTVKEYQENNSERLCPVCNKKELDID